MHDTNYYRDCEDHLSKSEQEQSNILALPSLLNEHVTNCKDMKRPAWIKIKLKNSGKHGE